MNKDMIQGKWTEFVGEAKTMWGNLTDNDFASAKGNVESLQGRLQAVYGYSKEKAKEELDCLVKKFSGTVAEKTQNLKEAVFNATESKGTQAKNTTMHNTTVAVAFMALIGGSYASNYAFAANKTAAQKMESVKRDARTAAYKLTDKDSLVVKFEKGSATISADEKNRIIALLDANAAKTEELKVMIAAWSDSDFIAKDKPAANATKNDKSLAAKRIKAVEEVLKKEKAKYSVDHKYNMAEKPSMLGEMIDSRDSVVKNKVVQGAETSSDALNQDIEKLRSDGGASRAIISIAK